MGNKTPSALAGAKGREVDLSIPNLSATALRDCHRRHIEEELGSKRAVQLAYAYGARSITLKQALDARFRMLVQMVSGSHQAASCSPLLMASHICDAMKNRATSRVIRASTSRLLAANSA